MVTICKTFNFCYGHRIWNQTLSGQQKCKCVRIHGHTGKIEVHLTSDTLVRGMVVDFNELRVIKEFIDLYVDHRFIMDVTDPLFQSLVEKYSLSSSDFIGTVAGLVVKELELNKVDKEFMDSFVLVPFEPTSENLASWMFHLVEELLEPFHVVLVKLRWWESESSFSEVVR